MHQSGKMLLSGIARALVANAGGERGLFAHYADARPPAGGALSGEATLLFFELFGAFGFLLVSGLGGIAVWGVLN